MLGFIKRVSLWTLILVSCISAQNTPGLTFLQMSTGSRAQGMGDAFTAIAQSSNGVHYNPAGMGFGSSRELMVFHSQWLADISIQNLTFFFPFNNRFGISSSISYLHTPSLTRYDIDPGSGAPIEDGTFDVYDLVATVGFGYRFTRNLSLGTNIKFFQESLESVTAQGLAFDFGLLAKFPASGFSFGASLQHLGSSVTYLSEQEKLPLTWRSGIAWKIRAINTTIAFDVAQTTGEDIQMLPGVEFDLANSLFLRGGYQVNDHLGTGMTAGVGLRLVNNHSVNYVYVPYGNLGDTHRAELIINFGTAPVSGSFFSSKSVSNSRNKAKSQINAEGGLEGRVDRESSFARNRLRPQPPRQVAVSLQPNNSLQITWQASDIPGTSYHIYARPGDGGQWIKLTARPVTKTEQYFKQRRRGLKLQFAVTAVLGEFESNFSTPVFFEID